MRFCLECLKVYYSQSEICLKCFNPTKTFDKFDKKEKEKAKEILIQEISTSRVVELKNEEAIKFVEKYLINKPDPDPKMQKFYEEAQKYAKEHPIT